MKKLLSIILVMGMLMLTGVTALAESAPDGTGTEVTEKKEKVEVPENIVTLRDAINTVNENIKSVKDSIKDIRSTRKDQAAEIKETVIAKKAEHKAFREEYSLIKENFVSLKNSLEEQAAAAKEAGDTEKLEVLKDEKSAATTVFEATKDDFLTKRGDFEEDKLEIEELRGKYKGVKDEVLVYVEAIKARHEQVVTLREDAKSAFDNQDFDTVANLLTEVLELKEANYNDLLMIQSLVQ